MTRRRRGLLIAAGIVAVVAGAAVAIMARPAWHVVETMRADADAREALPPGYIDDASRLNRTRVAEVVPAPADAGDREAALAALLARAKAEGLPVSIAGARHTMGGHVIAPDGMVIDMRPWRAMILDEETGLLAVGAGATWAEVLPYLDHLGRAVAVMQSNNSFSVGGSLSANCHGWQFGKPPIASTVASFRIMLADGSVRRCSRTENAELFSLALGGYGLFGIILDAVLHTVPNERYRLEQKVVPLAQALGAFDASVAAHPDAQLVYARLGIVPERLFEDVIVNVFYPAEGPPPPLHESGLATLRRAVFRGSASGDYGKSLRWDAETKLDPLLAGTYFSRNQLLNESVDTLANRSAETTDILHEYFVPRDRAEAFVGAARDIIRAQQANLLNVTVRDVREDKDTVLRYADRSMIAFVMLFLQPRTQEGEAAMRTLTRKLIDAAHEHGGRYYLPYRLHATREQFARAYPQAERFFERKLHYDPERRFVNRFWLEYGPVWPPPSAPAQQ